ncbi:NUDIX hydrolase [Candidatus Woesearchaeota archaeon]|nr:NUDIX hydrolase [Candidatus Woesearchaeota archaeon]
MKTYFVVTGIIRYNNKMLILKKADDDRYFPGHWSFCSGYLDEFESTEDAVLREAKEETGLDVELETEGKLVQTEVREGRRFLVMVYLCKASSDNIELCHENSDYRWITKEQIKEFKFVPGVIKDIESLGYL